MIEIKLPEWIHYLESVVLAAEGFLEIRQEMVIEDVYVSDAAPETGVMIGDRLFVSTAKYLPVRSFENPNDWYMDEDGERVLRKNLMIPVLAPTGTKIHLYGAGRIVAVGIRKKT